MRAPAFWTEDGPLAALLSPLGQLYAAGGRLRQMLASPERVGVPVICIGNVVAGGAGKTPVALAVAERLRAMGRRPHFLSRGYGGSEAGPLRVDPIRHSAAQVGDEPLLLADTAPAWIARDRIAGGRAAAAGGAGLLVMDDGFQNPALVKDLSLLVVDGGYGFGNRRVMPAGPLRETVGQALERADAVVLVGEDRFGVGRDLTVPVLTARLRPDPADTERLRGTRLLAFAGIGRPDKFFDSLRELGAELVGTKPFPDHHPYAEAEIADLLAQAAAIDALAVTTVKDAVRLPPAFRGQVATLRVTLEFDAPAGLDQLLEKLP